MIYLILDTNIWLYLANGHDPLSGKHEDDLHFQLLNQLQTLKANGDISILINDIIIEEWKRNKEHSKTKLKKLNNKLENPATHFSEIRRYITSDIKDIEQEYINGIKNEISANETHIENVESFLLNCEKVKIEDELKIKIFDLSISKKAPFHNKKNNVADASILFSADEYLKEVFLIQDESAFFVSNNFDDFTDGKDKDNFHPDIKSALVSRGLSYKRQLPVALKISVEVIKEIEQYHKHQLWLESRIFSCKNPYCDYDDGFDYSTYGYLDETLKVSYQNEDIVDPNQLNLFPDLPKTEKVQQSVSFGRCVICETPHVICPQCGELLLIQDESEEFICYECDTTMILKQEKNDKYLEVKNDSHINNLINN